MGMSFSSWIPTKRYISATLGPRSTEIGKSYSGEDISPSLKKKRESYGAPTMKIIGIPCVVAILEGELSFLCPLKLWSRLKRTRLLYLLDLMP